MGNYIMRTCPACNETTRRSEKGLCGDCKLLIKEAKEHREWIEKNTTDKEIFRLPSASYNLPYISHLPTYGRDLIDTAFFKLLELLSEPVNMPNHSVDFLIEGTTDSYRGKRVLVKTEIRELLNTIFQEIRQVSELAYKEGYKDGSNMIGRLAAGTLSIDDFNKITTKQ